MPAPGESDGATEGPGLNYLKVLRRTDHDPEKPRSPEENAIQQVDFRSVLKRKEKERMKKHILAN